MNKEEEYKETKIINKSTYLQIYVQMLSKRKEIDKRVFGQWKKMETDRVQKLFSLKNRQKIYTVLGELEISENQMPYLRRGEPLSLFEFNWKMPLEKQLTFFYSNLQSIYKRTTIQREN